MNSFISVDACFPLTLQVLRISNVIESSLLVVMAIVMVSDL